ncbi:MAG TPA: hypothetical protein PKB06_02515, partial [Actinotalea sp.]|nr:hypothetical protein [Actinotalea sp.]
MAHDSRAGTRAGERWRRVLSARARLARAGRRGRAPGQPVLGAGVVLASVLVATGMAVVPDWVPPAAMLLVVLMGVIVLRPVAMLAVALAVVAEILVLSVSGWAQLTPGAVVVLGIGLAAARAFV